MSVTPAWLARRRDAAVREGTLHGGLPYLATGHGPPLVVLRGLTSDHSNPEGLAGSMELRPYRALARHFTVYSVNRKPGLEPGATIADLAGHYAEAIRRAFPGPVDALGLSTGGTIAQRLAADHPELVRRLVLMATGHCLAPAGREAQRELARLTEAGEPRRAWSTLGPAIAGSDAGGRLMSALLWLTGPLAAPGDPTDLLVTIAAEDAYDAAGDLGRITAPTLVLAGGRDRCYGVEHARETAAGIPGARLVVYPERSHMGMGFHQPAMEEVVRFLTAAGPDAAAEPEATTEQAGRAAEPGGSA